LVKKRVKEIENDDLRIKKTISLGAQVTGLRNLNILWEVYTQLIPHKLLDEFIKENTKASVQTTLT